MATLKLTEKTLAAIAPPLDVPQCYAWDTELRGFGVVVGRKQRTFVVRARVAGKLVKRTIGVAGQPREDGQLWNVQMARLRARELLGQMAGGKTPEPKRTGSGPTLRDALDFHIRKMERGENRRRKVCSPRSVRTLRGTVELHLAEYLDRPLVDLTREVMRDRIDTIERDAARIAGSNPKNPPGRAVTNRLIANVSALWRSWDEEHDLPIKCPVSMKMQAELAARDNRIANAELPSWHAKVTGMDNPVRRDLQLVALFTGVRTEGVRNLRWTSVDFDGEAITIEQAKGDRPYSLPMTATVREILERRQTENATLMAGVGGDHGYVFPSLSADGEKVIAVAEVKERRVKRDAKGNPLRTEDGEYVRETYLPGVQACRKTYNSVAMEIGVPKEIRERLMNHEGRGVNVKSYGFAEADWTNTREWADQVEAALWQRIKGQTKRGKRGKAVQ